MFATKKKYYLIIQNIRDIDLSNIKSFNKFVIIYRNNIKNDKLKQLKQFRLKCKIKGIEFFVANDKKLLIKLRADGLYVSSHNKDLSINRLRSNYKIIGSIHNIKELNIKQKQMCSSFIYSRLFKTDYEFKHGHLGVIKFNLFCILTKKELISLGGIRLNNLNKLKTLNTGSVAIFSEIKKKPAVINRLF